MKEKETDIQQAICKYLELKGHFFWRNNNTPVYEKKSGYYRPMPAFSKKGVPDIIVVKDGFFIGLEVKTKNGKQSAWQKYFERGLKEAGGEYYIVRDIDNVKEIGL